MRIDPMSVATASAEAGTVRDGTRYGQRSTVPAPEPSIRSSAVTLATSQLEVSVILDEYNKTVYRFVDKTTGELVQQVPPEELLKVMHNIEEMLKQSETLDVVL